MAKTKTKPEIDYSKELKNRKHERFCQEYVVKLVVAEAYKVAYPKASQSTAEQNGSKLLKNIKVVGRISHLQAKLSEDSGVDALRIMEELKKIGFSNIDDYLRIDEDGNVIGRDFASIDRSKLAAIESIKQTTNITSNKDGDREYETRNFQFKLHDKLGAIEKMAKRIGFYGKHNDQLTDPMKELAKAIGAHGAGLQIRES
jgi:phage terminase small subunit